MNILWIHSVDDNTQMRSGSTLRVANISRHLLAAGHQVHLAAVSYGSQDSGERYVAELMKQGVISGHSSVKYPYSYNEQRAAGDWSHLVRVLAFRLLFGCPPVVNFILRKHQNAVRNLVGDIIERENIDAVIVGERRLWFLASGSETAVPAIIDFIDCWSLAAMRRLQLSVTRRKWSALVGDIQYLIWAVVEERYYGRRSSANVVVSPVDHRILSLVNGRRSHNFVVLNGIDARKGGSRGPKVKGRIIFSGNMDFAPNYEAALWFIDKVLPLVVKRRPDVRFVIAGANPVPELLARMSPIVEVLGYVDDMATEIARSELYVAPMVSGGGFKNKIVEALLSGTYVVATKLGVEFLPSHMRDKLLVSEKPEEMADQIVAFLDRPQMYAAALTELGNMVKTELSWKKKADEISAIVRDCVISAVQS